MGDGWKIAQELIRKNQNNSFGRNDYSIGTGDPRDYRPRKLTKKELRDKKWRKLDSDIIFYPLVKDKESPYYEHNLESDNIKDIKDFIQECRKKDKPVVMQIGEITISVDEKKPERITFSSSGKLGSFERKARQRYPYRITIKGEDMYSEVDIIDSSDYSLEAVYKEKGHQDVHVPVKVSQRVTIIDGEEISESFYVRALEKGIESSHIISKLLEANPEYQEGNGNEIYRENINPEEQISTLVSSESELKQHLPPNSLNYLGDNIPTGLYETYGQYYYRNKYNPHYAKNVLPLNSYAEGIAIAKDIEKHCKYIYSLIMQAYKGEHEKTESSEITLQQPDEGETIENAEESIYHGANADKDEWVYDENTGDSYDQEGYNRNGFNREGIHRETKSVYGPDGYDMYGFNKDGLNMYGETREEEAREAESQAKYETIHELGYDPENRDEEWRIEENNDEIKQSLIERVIEQQEIIAEQGKEIDRLKTQKEL
ncbi:MAG: hypothetical protein IJE68_02830 [Clostridia bacterium]|nr:hypothetical protein [Clostridia bacterium]